MDVATAERNQTGAAYLERLAALAPQLEAAAPRIEAERRIVEPVFSALVEGGFYRMLMPRSVGGSELDPMSFMRVIEGVAKLDASTAWCLCQQSGCSMAAAYLDPSAARDIFGNPRGILAWGPGPARAVAVPGGYRVTGNWSFASGGRHASWLGAHAPIFEADGSARPDTETDTSQRTFLIPATQTEMTDIWDVVGLKGTASDAFALKDHFVPAKYALWRDSEAERREPGRLYKISSSNMYSLGFACVALGIARSTLDAFVKLALEKTPRGAAKSLRDNNVIQSQIAQGEAKLRAARLYVFSTIEEIWDALATSERTTIQQRMAIRLASTYTIHQAKEVVYTAYHAAGATAIFASNPFERRFRDVHTVSQQVQGSQVHFETVGQFILGLPPNTAFL